MQFRLCVIRPPQAEEIVSVRKSGSGDRVSRAEGDAMWSAINQLQNVQSQSKPKGFWNSVLHETCVRVATWCALGAITLIGGYLLYLAIQLAVHLPAFIDATIHANTAVYEAAARVGRVVGLAAALGEDPRDLASVGVAFAIAGLTVVIGALVQPRRRTAMVRAVAP